MNNDSNYKFEKLGSDFEICVSTEHKFGTDAFLLANFASVRRKDTCCDMGSGCGIIPSLWYRWEQNPKLAYAVEIQQQGYEQMLVTVEKNGLADRLIPICADLNDLPQTKVIPLATLDVITCNPPFKKMGHGIPCPTDARLSARHEINCTADDICKVSSKLLKGGGKLCICQRPERLPDIMRSMQKYGIEPKRLRFVQKHADTKPWLFLIEGRRGGKPFLEVEAPLVVENADGGFSDEMLKIYGLYANDSN